LLEQLQSAGSVALEADWPRLTGAAIAAAAVLALLWFARGLARRQHARLARTEATEVLEIPMLAASRTTLAFMVVVAAYTGLASYGLEGRAAQWALRILTIAGFWQAGLWASTAAVAWLDHRRQVTLAEDKAVAGSIGIICFVARVLIWGMVLLLTLDNLGVDITALVAGLGIGGIAVALALQNVLGDLLASLSIALDQPFVIGDFLIVGDHMGSVEYIGIKSTRLRSLTGEQIVISNADLLSSRVRNYGRMYERRIVFSLGVTYETQRAKLERIPALLRGIIESQDGVRFDRAHFAKYGDFSLDFEIVYHVLSADYGRYMDVQQAINFRIHEAFEKLGVQFAYPTQTVWVAGAGASSRTGSPRVTASPSAA
jgi:small-conductance mechanosensitive channel